MKSGAGTIDQNTMPIPHDDFKVSLLIPTYKPSSVWKAVLDAIAIQSLKANRKIIIDSGSDDESLNLALSHRFEVHRIDKNEFGHGKTRQQLVDLAIDTDICVFMTQDAIPASAYSLENLVRAFVDPQVGIAYGRQLPHKGARTLETHARLYNYPEVSSVLNLADSERLGFKIFFCSNSFAAYRRSDLMAIGGFSEDSIMGEDAIAAAKMLLRGIKKAYVAEAPVYHSHDYTFGEEFRRHFDTRVFHEQNKWLIDRFGKPGGEGFKFTKSQLSYVLKNDLLSMPKATVSLGAKWAGYQAGKYYKNMSCALLKRFSMHSYYWENSNPKKL